MLAYSERPKKKMVEVRVNQSARKRRTPVLGWLYALVNRDRK